MKSHELARELGISQKELVNFLQQRRLTRNAAAPLAPGAIGSMFGFPNQFTTKAESASTVPLPTTIQNTQVLVNGVAAPIYYLGPNQINFQVPMSTPTAAAVCSNCLLSS